MTDVGFTWEFPKLQVCTCSVCGREFLDSERRTPPDLCFVCHWESVVGETMAAYFAEQRREQDAREVADFRSGRDAQHERKVQRAMIEAQSATIH